MKHQVVCDAVDGEEFRSHILHVCEDERDRRGR